MKKKYKMTRNMTNYSEIEIIELEEISEPEVKSLEQIITDILTKNRHAYKSVEAWREGTSLQITASVKKYFSSYVPKEEVMRVFNKHFEDGDTWRNIRTALSAIKTVGETQ